MKRDDLPRVDRAGRLAGLATGEPCDLLLFESSPDIRWATGFGGSTAALLVDPLLGRARLLVDARYVERAEADVLASRADVEVVAVGSDRGLDATLAALAGGRVIGLNPGTTTLSRMRRLAAVVQVTEASSCLADVRRRKSPEEIAVMAFAASVATDALLSVVADGLAGRSEREIRSRLDGRMLEFGADGPAFTTIVASGPRAARPHHEAGDDRVVGDDVVIVDIGAEVGGYRSDMTRVVQVGNPDPERSRMLEIVRAAQAAGVASVRAGVVGSDVDAAVRRVFAGADCESEFIHGTGHGVGLEIHENPILGPRCDAVLREGEVVTVEPGLYRVGVGGVRIEDLVVVGADGCRNLTPAPKELSCPRSRPTT
jgi:Xaa-Pro aminopeptidase